AALPEPTELLRGVGCACQQLLVARAAEPPPGVCDPVEARLDFLDAARVGVEGGEESAQSACRLAEPELDVAQLVARPGKLRREPLHAGDGSLRGGDQVCRTAAVLGIDRARPCGCRLDQLAGVSKPLAFGAK